MKTWGGMLMVVGVLTVLSALFIMQTTVESGYGSLSSGSVINLGLLQRQTLFTHIGLALFISGAIFTAAGSMPGGQFGGIPRIETPVPDEAFQHGYQAPVPAADDDKRLWVICGVVIAIVAAAVLYNAWSSTLNDGSAAAAVAGMNAEELADNMEMQADAMDAMADNLTDAK